MRKLMICLTGAAMVLLAPSLSNAASFGGSSAPGVHNSVEQARMVRRCHTGKVWRNGPHGRHLVTKRVCHMVEVR